ncbi:Hsp70 family protein [Streptomyces uncialis]|uniref:Hsp70 family protein n=1 Tax=Streptomyces uncialis TaxID=1048205 RepID=UPI00225957B5|nr:Hsp70 family protein [Streptomyces uncialis]MCX4658782.1 Hsp70 family protein [Streptomyces uncialis]
MIVSVDVGASTTKSAVLAEGTADAVTVRLQGLPEWPTALMLGRDGTLITGTAAANLRDAAPYKGRYLWGLKQQINLAARTEPLHREVHFPSGDTQPLVRGVAAVLTHTLRAVTEQYGAPTRLVLTHPVLWTDAEQVVLTEAATAAGHPSAGLVSEAEAVGLHAVRRLPGDGPFAVLDFGASTFDFALLDRRGDGSPEVVYETGRLIGGDDFDTRVLQLVRDSATAEERRVLDELTATRPELLRQEAEEVKRALTVRDEAGFGVWDLDIEVQRADFADAIDPLVTTCVAAAREALSALDGTRPRAIVLSGGAARVPQVREHVAGLAASLGAELIDLVDGVDGSPVALGATRAPARSRTGRAPRPARPFTVDPAVLELGHPDTSVVGVLGGVLALRPERELRGWQLPAYGDAAQGGAPDGPTMPVSRIAGDPASTRVVLASPSPAFLVTTVDGTGGLGRSVVFGRLATARGAAGSTVSALACRGLLIAWVETDGRGTIVDTLSWHWRTFPLPELVNELSFTDKPWLIARLPDRLLLFDVLTLRRRAELGLPDSAALAVEPRHGTVCVAYEDEVVAYRTGTGCFEVRWRRPLRSHGAIAFTHTGDEAAVVVFDSTAQVYRALHADTGDQLGLRDAIGLDRPEALHPSPDRGVVYARAGAGLDRLRLGTVSV